MSVSFVITYKVVSLFVICFIQYSSTLSFKSGSLQQQQLAESNHFKASTLSEDVENKSGTFTESSSTTPSSTSAPPASTRRFDALSFIGGIILTYGFLAVMYVGFRFYKARTQKNYNNM